MKMYSEYTSPNTGNLKFLLIDTKTKDLVDFFSQCSVYWRVKIDGNSYQKSSFPCFPPARLVSNCCCSEKGVSVYRISHKQSTLELLPLKNAKLFASEAFASHSRCTVSQFKQLRSETQKLMTAREDILFEALGYFDFSLATKKALWKFLC